MQLHFTNIQEHHPSPHNLIEEKIAKICDFNNQNCALSQARKYHLKVRGGRKRSNLTCKFAKILLTPDESAVYLACISELLHNASLIHDDIQDLDEKRRNTLSVWEKFDLDIAICAGDYLISSAYRCIANINTRDARSITKKNHSYIHGVIKGQIRDLTQDKNQTLLDVDLYQKISRQKSGPLLAMSLTLRLIYTNRLAYIVDAEETLYSYAVAYQIYDDIHDIEQDQDKQGIKSGLNIVTIMKKNNEPSGIKASSTLAMKNLNKALEHFSRLSFPGNKILENEINDMQQKLSLIGTN